MSGYTQYRTNSPAFIGIFYSQRRSIDWGDYWNVMSNWLVPGAMGVIFVIGNSKYKIAGSMDKAGFVIHPSLFLFDEYQSIGIMAQKPCEQNYIDNLIKFGAGALNIDGTRIGLTSTDVESSRILQHSTRAGRTHDWGYNRKNSNSQPMLNENGRWPSHVLLQHKQDCVRSNIVTANYKHQRGKYVSLGVSTSPSIADIATTQETETFIQWECDLDCPAYKLNLQYKDRGNNTPASIRFFNADWDYETKHKLPIEGISYSVLRYIATMLLPPSTYAPRNLLVLSSPADQIAKTIQAAMDGGWERVTVF